MYTRRVTHNYNNKSSSMSLLMTTKGDRGYSNEKGSSYIDTTRAFYKFIASVIYDKLTLK